jgi:arsenite-transporting ATPase
MSRIIIFTGKGGVGKTSVVAAHALRAARGGMNTLLVSADMAHNLGDVFEIKTHGERTIAEDRLTLLELDPGKIMREDYPDLNRSIVEMISSSARSDAVGSDFMFPGLEDLFMLLGIRDLYKSGAYDLILVDCAPSGETLSLLKLPELLEWYMEKFFPVGKFMTRVLAPVSGALYKVKLPSSEAMDQVSVMHRNLVELQALLKDPENASVRLVTLPEKMVNEETKRTYMYLNLYGYHVDRVFINRTLPPQPDNPFMENWREIQRQYIEEMERVFTYIPITKIPWYPEEIKGIASLERLAAELPENEELFAVRPQRAQGAPETDVDADGTLYGGPEVYEATKEGYLLKVSVPGAESAEVKRCGQDLEIRVGNQLRIIPLPSTLCRAQIVKTEVKEGVLQAAFSFGQEAP